MTGQHRKSAAICAIVFAFGLVLHASAQPAPVAATAARPNEPSQQRLLIAAKQRPEAVKLRALLARGDAAKRVDLKAIDKSSVPVLVSARPTLVQNLRVFAKPHSYAASAHAAGLLIQINGTSTPAEAPKGFRMPSAIRTMKIETAAGPGDMLENVRVDRTSSGIDVSFTRFGAVYNLSLDCGDAGETDPERIGPAPGAKKAQAPSQCSETNALAIARELEVIGGGAAP